MPLRRAGAPRQSPTPGASDRPQPGPRAGVVNFIGAYIPFLGAFIGGAFAVLMVISEGGLGLAAPLTSIGFNLFSELKSSGFFDDDLGDTLEPDELDVQRGSQPET